MPFATIGYVFPRRLSGAMLAQREPARRARLFVAAPPSAAAAGDIVPSSLTD